MVRKVVNLLSPLAALAVVWISLQSFGFTSAQSTPSDPLLAPPTSRVSEVLLPELSSVSKILATTSTKALGETVPDTVRRILIKQRAVLLVPDNGGGQ